MRHRRQRREYKTKRRECRICGVTKSADRVRLFSRDLVGKRLTDVVRNISGIAKNANRCYRNLARLPLETAIQPDDAVCLLCARSQHGVGLVYDLDTVCTDAERVEQLAHELRKPEHALVVLWRDARLEMIEWEGSERTQVPRRVGRWWRRVLGGRNGARLAELEECASQDAALKRDLDELFARTLPHQVETYSRRVIIMQRHVESACGGYVPRAHDTAQLAGWSEEGAPPEKVLVGRWYRDFVQRKIGDRLRAAVTEPAVLAALDYLEQQPPRPRPPQQRMEDTRKVVIFAKHVEENCHGKLPRTKDCAELEGWDHENAGAARVQVGQWWYDFTTTNDGARKKRVVEAAARDDDTATREALQYLATRLANGDEFVVFVSTRLTWWSTTLRMKTLNPKKETHLSVNPESRDPRRSNVSSEMPSPKMRHTKTNMCATASEWRRVGEVEHTLDVGRKRVGRRRSSRASSEEVRRGVKSHITKNNIRRLISVHSYT